MHRATIQTEDLLEPSAVIDQDGDILNYNQEWRNFYSRGNFLRQLARKPDRLGFRELLIQLFHQRVDSCACEFAWSEGRWLRGSAKRLSNDSNRYLIRLDNISATIQNRTRLTQLQSLVEQMSNPVFLLDPNTAKTVYANEALKQIMEVDGTLDDLKAPNYGPMFSPDSLPKLVSRLAFCGTLSLTLATRTNLGRRFPARYDVMLLNGSRPLVGGVINNLSERKRQLSVLQTTSSRLKAILESAPVAIVTFTLEGLVSSWNPAAERMYGWSSDEVLLKSSPFENYLSNESIREVVEQGSTITMQLVRQCKSGQSIHLSLSLCPLLNESSLLAGLLEVAEDITDRVNEDLRLSNLRMLESREAERLALAREIHDGPLQELMVVGFSLAEARCVNAGTAAAEAIPQIQSAVVQVSQHLRSVISRLRPAGLAEFGLVPSLEGAVARFLREHPNSPQISLNLKQVKQLSHSQELCLFRIVQEGLQNCLRHAKARSVTLSLRQLSSEVELVLSDDGEGFSVPGHLRELAQAEHYGLLGMQERAVLSGGSLVVDSKPGQGTRLQVLIPTKGIPE